MDGLSSPEYRNEGWLDPVDLSIGDLARIAKSLGHVARVGIVQQLHSNRPHMTREIAERCDRAQSTVSEHLRILREAGLLVTQRDGSRTWYRLRRSVLRQFAEAVELLTGEAFLTDSGYAR